MKKCNIIVLPDNIKITVKKGKNLLETLIDNEIYIDSYCGGKGTCGRCKVKILGDNAKTSSYTLACQTYITDDLKILIPSESRLSKPKILTVITTDKKIEIQPLSVKCHIHLTPPSVNDNTDDVQRILKEVKRHHCVDMIDFELIKRISRILRESNWNITVTITEQNGKYIITDIEYGNRLSNLYGVSVDIGTTTVTASLFNLENGNIIGTVSDYNEQIIYGADVISRIDYAIEEVNGLTKLRNKILKTVNQLIDKLTENRINKKSINYISISGNTIMMHLFLGISPENIKFEPYIPVFTCIPQTKAKSIGINVSNAYIHIVPCVSGYVGGDIICDILVSGMHRRKEISMLIDVGTNGEIVLGNRDWLVACASSCGPAFEGGDVKCGTRAIPGAIEKVDILPDHSIKYTTIDNMKPIGICGSGLIDVLSGFFQYGIIDRKGKYRDTEEFQIGYNKTTKVKEFVLVDKKYTSTKKPISILETDIQSIIRTKAAIYAATRVLLKTIGCEIDEITKIYIAGGFGNFIDINKAICIGMFPDTDRDKFIFLGNASLTGARMVILSRKKMKEAEKISKCVTYLELSVNQRFFDEFTSALFLPHTDISLFPTVNKIVSGTES